MTFEEDSQQYGEVSTLGEELEEESESQQEDGVGTATAVVASAREKEPKSQRQQSLSSSGRGAEESSKRTLNLFNAPNSKDVSLEALVIRHPHELCQVLAE